MALAPKFAGHRLPAASSSAASRGVAHQHTLELYLDYVCPFSAKLFNTFYSSVVPLLQDPDGPYAGRVQVIFRQQVQPWHPSSTLVHEAALAVEQVAPDLFWAFSEALFARQKEYFDLAVVDETRNQTYGRLADLAVTTVTEAYAKKVGGSDGFRDHIYNALHVGERPGLEGQLNTGNQVTDDLKQVVKANRVVGVHVSPTVFFNGIEEKSISSSFTVEQWKEWLDKNVI